MYSAMIDYDSKKKEMMARLSSGDFDVTAALEQRERAEQEMESNSPRCSERMLTRALMSSATTWLRVIWSTASITS
jgi:hypothetical protein